MYPSWRDDEITAQALEALLQILQFQLNNEIRIEYMYGITKIVFQSCNTVLRYICLAKYIDVEIAINRRRVLTGIPYLTKCRV